MDGLLVLLFLIFAIIFIANLFLGVGLCFGPINPSKWKIGYLSTAAALWGLVIGGVIGFETTSLMSGDFGPVIIGALIGVMVFPILTKLVPGINRFVVGFLVTMKLTSMLTSVFVQTGELSLDDSLTALFMAPLIVGTIGGLFLAMWVQMKVSAFVYSCAFIGATQLAPAVSELIGYLLSIVTGDPSYAFAITDVIKILTGIEVTDLWTVIATGIFMYFGIKKQMQSLRDQNIPPDTPIITVETTNPEHHGQVNQDGKAIKGAIAVNSGKENDKGFLEERMENLHVITDKWKELQHPFKDEILDNRILIAVPIIIYLLLPPLFTAAESEWMYSAYTVFHYCAVACFIYTVYNCSKPFSMAWPIASIIQLFITDGSSLFEHFDINTALILLSYFIIWGIAALAKKFVNDQFLGMIITAVSTIIIFEIVNVFLAGLTFQMGAIYFIDVFACTITLFLLQGFYKENKLETTSQRKLGILLLTCVGAPLIIGAASHFTATHFENADLQADGDPSASAFKDDENEITPEGADKDYILKTSDEKLLTESDLEGLTDEELRLARNEIFARHGRTFEEAGLQQYFDSKDWYSGTIEPKDFQDSMLSTIEKDNVNIIYDQEGKLTDVRNKSFKLIGMTAGEIEEKYGELKDGLENGYPDNGTDRVFSVGETGLFITFSEGDFDKTDFDRNEICAAVEGAPTAFFYNVDDLLDLEGLAETLNKEIKHGPLQDYIEVSDGNWLTIDYYEELDSMWVCYSKPS